MVALNRISQPRNQLVVILDQELIAVEIGDEYRRTVEAWEGWKIISDLLDRVDIPVGDRLYVCRQLNWIEMERQRKFDLMHDAASRDSILVPSVCIAVIVVAMVAFCWINWQ